MEAIHVSPTHIEIFVAGKEFFVLLRPGGMLAGLVASIEPSADFLVKKMDASGAILRISTNCASAIFRAEPQHACDDRLRYVLACLPENLPSKTDQNNCGLPRSSLF